MSSAARRSSTEVGNERRDINAQVRASREYAAVAERIAKVLAAPITDPDESLPSCLSEARLIGFGSGIYYGRFHRSLRRWIANLPNDCGVGRLAFVYSTSGLPFLSAIYHRTLVRALERRGFEVVGEFACRGHDSFGPLWLVGGINRKHPDAEDLARGVLCLWHAQSAREVSRIQVGASGASKSGLACHQPVSPRIDEDDEMIDTSI